MDQLLQQVNYPLRIEVKIVAVKAKDLQLGHSMMHVACSLKRKEYVVRIHKM